MNKTILIGRTTKDIEVKEIKVKHKTTHPICSLPFGLQACTGLVHKQLQYLRCLCGREKQAREKAEKRGQKFRL